MRRSLILIVILGILGSVSGIVASQISLPNSLHEIIWPLYISLSIAMIAFTAITQTSLINSKGALYWASVIVFLGSLGSFIGWAYITAKPATNYFILDATENMDPFFDAVHNQLVDVASRDAMYRQGIALRIFGGRIFDNGTDNSDSQQCEANSQLLVNPGYYKDAEMAINNPSDSSHPGLDDIQPSGFGSLIVSIRFALMDITNYDKPVTMIIITSGTYSECIPPPEGYVQDTIKVFNSLNTNNSNVDLRMLIISIGKPSIQTLALLDTYANDFNGCYISVLTSDNLPSIIQTNSSYCSNYPLSKPK